jgi:tyrosinase
MPVSRRHVMLQGAVIGAGIISSSIPSMKALAAGQPPLRRTLQGLAWNDPIVETYRDGVGLMKQKQPSDKTSWAGLASIHGSNPNAYHFCPHGNWYFLPWHRAYIVMYERFIRQLTNNNDFALPFWDWTSNPTMPAVFTSAKLPNGKPNALFVDDQDFGQSWKRTWPAKKPMPANIVGHAVLQEILNSADYEEFGTSRPQGQNNTNPSWVLKRTGVQGVLEGTAHNNVHNNIGGWMPSASSPRDPIFFMHHCNIDRIWAVWNSLGNENSPESLWRDMTFTNNFLNTDGSQWSPKVSDLFEPEKLGYTYGLSTPVASAGPTPNLVALRNTLATLHAAPSANAAGAKSFTAVPPAQAVGTATAPLAVAVNVDPALVASVVKRTPVPSGAEFTNFAAAQEQRASGPRVLAFVRDVAVTGAQDTEYQVYLDTPDFNPQNGPSDPSYVGSFGVFVHGEHGGHGGAAETETDTNPSFVLDLTAAIQRVYGSGQQPPSTIKLRFVPAVSKPNAARAGTIRPGQVEIVFLNA